MGNNRSGCFKKIIRSFIVSGQKTNAQLGFVLYGPDIGDPKPQQQFSSGYLGRYEHKIEFSQFSKFIFKLALRPGRTQLRFPLLRQALFVGATPNFRHFSVNLTKDKK